MIKNNPRRTDKLQSESKPLLPEYWQEMLLMGNC